MPKAMFAATPPRRTCESEVSNDREILSSCSTTSESAKRPSKVMRWSVAMEPVIAICTGRTYPSWGQPRRGRPGRGGRGAGAAAGGRAGRGATPAGRRACGRARPSWSGPSGWRCKTGASGSAEGVAARAAAAGVRVVDREALLLDRVGEVDRGALEVGGAHPVDDDLDTVEVADEVAVEAALVEVELVDQARAAAGLDAHTQAQVVATLLLEQALDLRGRDVRQDDAVGGSLGLSLGGRCVRLDTHVLVLHVVEHGSGVTTHAAPDVFPDALPPYVRGGGEECTSPPGSAVGVTRRTATRCVRLGRSGRRAVRRGRPAQPPPAPDARRWHTPPRARPTWPRGGRR